MKKRRKHHANEADNFNGIVKTFKAFEKYFDSKKAEYKYGDFEESEEMKKLVDENADEIENGRCESVEIQEMEINIYICLIILIHFCVNIIHQL